MRFCAILLGIAFIVTSTGVSSDPFSEILHEAQRDWGYYPVHRITFKDLGGCHSGAMWIAFAEPADHATWSPGRRWDGGDIVLNSECPWTSGYISILGATDKPMSEVLPSVLRHEIGHLLGLSHSTSEFQSIMAPGGSVLIRDLSISKTDRELVSKTR